MSSTDPRPEIQALGESTSERVVISGPPQRLRGQFWLSNTTESKLSLRGALLRVNAAPGAGAGPNLTPAAGLTARIRVAGRFAPGDRRLVSIRAKLDRYYPPGTYLAEIETATPTGSHAVAAELHVFERRGISLRPRHVVLVGEPGAEVEWTFAATNTGNVPIEFPPLGSFAIEDETLSCRIARRSLKSYPDPPTTFEESWDHLVGQAKQTLEDLGKLRVENDTPGIPPGETRLVSARARIPETIPRGGRYFVLCRAIDDTVTLLIAVAAKP